MACEPTLDSNDVQTHNHSHTHVLIETNGFPYMSIPDENPLTKEGIELGRRLFYDKRLSGNNTQSCASCHVQEFAFSDPRRFSVGIDGFEGSRNASALVNVGWNTSFFWDGRAGTLEDQVLMPVEDPVEMHETWATAIAEIKLDTTYVRMFQVAFETNIINKTYASHALSQFCRSLISDGSKYDKLIAGLVEFNALEAAGYNLFFSEKAECFHCHGTILFTDQDFHNNSLQDNYPSDIGKEAVSGDINDRAMFRTPTLRNIELTAPYMHDGRFNTLEEVVEFYSSGQMQSNNVDALMRYNDGGYNFTELEKMQLVAFLKTLTDTNFVNNPDFSNPFEE